MSANEKISVCVRLVSAPDPTIRLAPEALRDAVLTDVSDTESSLNDVVVGILAEKFGQKFEPSGRHTVPNPEVFHLRMTQRLNFAIDQAKAKRRRRGWTIPDEIRTLLCEHYGIDPLPKPPRRAKAAV